MNSKEKQMLLHYKNRIEKRLFDEYDIYGFLILIRNYISEEKFPLIKEFAHNVAHSERNRGMMLENIETCIDNNYKTIDGKRVVNYKGYSEPSWNEEWKNVMAEFDIKLNDIILKELTLYVFSLFQNVTYVDERDSNHKIGNLKLLINPDNKEIYLCTSEGTQGSYIVCFTKLENINIKGKFSDYLGCGTLETFRDGEILKLRYDKEIISEIS